jgi:hypothetical protein
MAHTQPSSFESLTLRKEDQAYNSALCEQRLRSAHCAAFSREFESSFRSLEPTMLYLKNAPLMTALRPAVRVTWIVTCPDMFQIR